MTGYDIRNAMRRAYGYSERDDHERDQTLDDLSGRERLHRLLLVLMMAMKGWV